jgi:CRP-like cAMP-binding protein
VKGSPGARAAPGFFLPFGKSAFPQNTYIAPMETLINLILQFGDLNKQQIDLILSKANTLHLKKDEYFSEAGKIPRYVGFVLEGVFRFCYYNNKGEEITNYFIDEGNFVSDNEKFESQIAASEYIQAVTDCTVLVFTKKDWDDISDTIVGFDLIKANIVKKCLTVAMERRSPLVAEDATTRYLSFIESFPALINRIPLSYVASYLGITQQSLSRIRRNIR